MPQLENHTFCFDRYLVTCYSAETSRFTSGEIIMCFTRRALACLFVLIVTLPSWPDSLYSKPKYENIQVRLIAREQLAPITSGARNTDWYVVELQGKSGEKHMARLTYSFLAHEARLPESFLNYATVHKFRAVREKSCDSSMAQVAQRNLQYSTGVPKSFGQNAALPCYVVTPKDYRGSTAARP
jgi:hypothetical protein